jgi:hypothetical protein
MSDYLWDKSGEPDPEVERLELMLARFRHNRPAPDFPERLGFWDRVRAGWAGTQGWSLPRLAAVAAVALLAAGAWLFVRQTSFVGPQSVPSAAWNVACAAGMPTIGTRRMGETGRLAVGQTLETDAVSRALINAGTVGEVQVDPGSRLRLVESRSARYRLALERGTIHAMIWAPPGEFVVDTPSAVAVDLGCAYTLQVNDTGAGLLRVTFGWVGFTLKGHESLIPEGALCAMRPGIGPGTPYFDDASPAFKAALGQLDFEQFTPGSQADRAAALETVLTNARQRDALTLWHLLARLDGSERAQVYDRFAALVPPPAGVTRAGILRGDKHMRDLWWNVLGLGDTSWWRMWQRQARDWGLEAGD